MPLCPRQATLRSANREPAAAHHCPFTNNRQHRSRAGVVNVVCAAAAMRTHYDVLGVRETASVRDVKDAFRRLALMWHPDRCKQPGAKDKFMELKAAYDTLVDLAARSKYDLQLKQVAAPPQAPKAGPTTVGYDWAKYRTTSIRRAGSVRKGPQQTGFASSTVPPRPPAKSSSGDDFEHFSSRVAGGAAGFNGGASTPQTSRSASTYDAASTSGRTASAAANGSGGNGYRSIFNNNPNTTSTSGTAGGSSTSENCIFTRVTSAQQPRAGEYTAFSRSSSRSSSRSGSWSRYSRSSTPSRSGSTSAWASRPASPTPAQQWHSMYCHSGDDFMASSGTSYAATTALVRYDAYAANRHNSASGSTATWHGGVSGDGFADAALPPADSSIVALQTQVSESEPATWSASSWAAGGDDYAANQHALVRVEQKAALPVKATPLWSTVASFISIGMK